MGAALLVLLAVLTATGWMPTVEAWSGDERIEDLLAAVAWARLGFVGLRRVAGVGMASLEHGENLARAMITGRMRR